MRIMAKNQIVKKSVSMICYNASGNHWVTALLIRELKTLVILDALACTTTKSSLLPLINYINKQYLFETGVPLLKDGFKLHHPADLSLQKGKTACGIWVMLFVEVVCSGSIPDTLDIGQMRAKVLKLLLKYRDVSCESDYPVQQPNFINRQRRQLVEDYGNTRLNQISVSKSPLRPVFWKKPSTIKWLAEILRRNGQEDLASRRQDPFVFTS